MVCLPKRRSADWDSDRNEICDYRRGGPTGVAAAETGRLAALNTEYERMRDSIPNTQ